MTTNNEATKTEAKAHPFERAGMGVGPYKWVGTVEIPNAAEFSGSAAGFGGGDRYAEVKAANLKAGGGTCCCCGMGISIICVVQDAAGDRWGVGSDCVMKTGDAHLGNAAKVAVAKRRRAKDAAKREAKRREQQEKFLDSASTDTRALPGETNRQLQDRLNAEWKAKEAARAAHGARMAPVVEVLNQQRGEFCRSMAQEFSQGRVPSGRALAICRDIYGKAKARLGYDAMVEEFDKLVSN